MSKLYKNIKTNDVFLIDGGFEHAVYMRKVKDSDGNDVENEDRFYIDWIHLKSNFKRLK